MIVKGEGDCGILGCYSRAEHVVHRDLSSYRVEFVRSTSLFEDKMGFNWFYPDESTGLCCYHNKVKNGRIKQKSGIARDFFNLPIEDKLRHAFRNIERGFERSSSPA